MKRILITIIIAIHCFNVSAQKLKFKEDGTFKIVQFTDVHYSSADERSKLSKECIINVLDAEKPDLVVFTGDIVCSAPSDKGWEEITSFVESKAIPYAVTFGNHDDECGLSREQISNILETKKLSLFKGKVKGVSGYGNYVVEIASKDGKEISALIYCMDSRSYSTNKNTDGYGWFSSDQINWYEKLSATYTNNNSGTPLPALAFFHIPLPEYEEAYNYGAAQSGLRKEPECAPKINTGMFAAMLQAGDIMGISVGHDHTNDYVALKNNISLCYGQFTGSDITYGFNNKINGGRVFELKECERSFKTWIRYRDGSMK